MLTMSNDVSEKFYANIGAVSNDETVISPDNSVAFPLFKLNFHDDSSIWKVLGIMNELFQYNLSSADQLYIVETYSEIRKEYLQAKESIDNIDQELKGFWSGGVSINPTVACSLAKEQRKIYRQYADIVISKIIDCSININLIYVTRTRATELIANVKRESGVDVPKDVINLNMLTWSIFIKFWFPVIDSIITLCELDKLPLFFHQLLTEFHRKAGFESGDQDFIEQITFLYMEMTNLNKEIKYILEMFVNNSVPHETMMSRSTVVVIYFLVYLLYNNDSTNQSCMILSPRLALIVNQLRM